jgi:hypothetical protein
MKKTCIEDKKTCANMVATVTKNVRGCGATWGVGA